MKTTDFINSNMALNNELRKAMDMSTPETWPQNLNTVLSKFGLEDELSTLELG